MTPAIEFSDLSFFYVNEDAPADPRQLTTEDLTLVFEHLDLHIPRGLTALIGENGVGKSTLLLLAGGRLFPAAGSVSLLGTDTAAFRGADQDPALEEERNRLVSFVYQNMEFETDLALGEVLGQVFAGGFHDPSRAGLVDEIVRSFDLSDYLPRPMAALAKGPMQRAVMAMALLYGSKIILMDEPVFAMEEPRKEQVMEYVRAFSKQTDTPVVYTAHNIDLCRKYSESMLILKKNPDPGSLPYLLGPTREVCTKENIVAAYRVPYDTLHHKEHLYREMLLNRAKDSAGQEGTEPSA